MAWFRISPLRTTKKKNNAYFVGCVHVLPHPMDILPDTYNCGLRMPGTFSPPPRVSDPDMYHGTCVTHVPWCLPASLTSALTSGYLWSRWRGKRSLHSRCTGNPQFNVSGKRPMEIMLSNGTLVTLTPHSLYTVQNSQQMYSISDCIHISYAYINSNHWNRKHGEHREIDGASD